MKMNKILYLSALLLLFSSVALGQRTITGRVLAMPEKRPLEGATIKLKGYPGAVRSLRDGTFRVAVSPGASVLVASYLGYETKEVTVKEVSDRELSIYLNPAQSQLKEVTVSTGYQQLPRERATGSFEKIDSAALSRIISPSILTRLDGLVSGVVFDRRGSYSINGPVNINNTFTVRGLSTLNSNASPLIILDNFPYEGDINDINPNDILDISVLKDASAASIWGARAGNGVIVITTRKGRYNAATRIGFTSNLSVASKPDLFSYHEISSADYISAERYLFDQGFYNALESGNERAALSPVIEMLIKKRDGLLSPEQAQSQIEALATADVRNDYLENVYRKSLNRQAAVNVSGGSESYHYLISAGYDNNRLQLINTHNDRISLRAENSIRLSKKLELQAQIIYTMANNYSTPASFAYNQLRVSGKRLYPYARLVNSNGEPAEIATYRQGFLDTAGNGKLLDWRYKPLVDAEQASLKVKAQNALLNAGISYRFSPSFSADVKYQYQRGTSNTGTLYSEESYYTRNLVNFFTQINPDGVTRPVPAGAILDQGNREMASYSARGQLSYSNVFNGIHSFSAIAGGEIRQTKTEGTGTRIYGYSESPLSSSVVDLTHTYPVYDNISYDQYIPDNSFLNSYLNRYTSLYANMSYSLLNRYTLSGSVRKDASNILGVKTNEKGVPLWSTGITWDLSKENFYQLSFLPQLKLRYTLGYSGNVNTGLSAYATIMFYSNDPSAFNQTYASVLNPPNPELRWEKVRMQNFAVDFSAFGNRFRGSIEHYRKKTSDLLALTPVDGTTGFTTATRNSGSTFANGWDINLTSENLRGKLKWSSNYLFSYNRTKVRRYDYEYSNAGAYVGSGATVTPLKGSMVYPVISYRWAGLNSDTGDPQGYLEGKVSTDYSAIISKSTFSDLVFHGSAIPLYFGTFRNTFSFRDFSLSAGISFRFDYYFRRASLSYYDLFYNGLGNKEYADRWQKQGDERTTNVPSLSYPADSYRDQFYNFSEVTVERGDNIRLQDITFSWQVPSALLSRFKIKSARIYSYLNNLGILWRKNKLGLDPDYGTDNIAAPRSLAIGISADF